MYFLLLVLTVAIPIQMIFLTYILIYVHVQQLRFKNVEYEYHLIGERRVKTDFMREFKQ